LIIEDLKVCGRGDLQKLLTMRHKYQANGKKTEVVEEKTPVVELDSDA